MMRSYAAVLATETPWYERMYLRDPESGYYRPGWVKFQLTIEAGTIFMSLDTPAGVGVLWRHGDWFEKAPATGRVLSAAIRNRRLEGRVGISEAPLLSFVPGGFETLEEGVNSGLSIGANPIDIPELERRSGTREDPHVVQYGRIRVGEVSLTPIPKLLDAGIDWSSGRTEGAEPDDSAQEVEANE